MQRIASTGPRAIIQHSNYPNIEQFTAGDFESGWNILTMKHLCEHEVKTQSSVTEGSQSTSGQRGPDYAAALAVFREKLSSTVNDETGNGNSRTSKTIEVNPQELVLQALLAMFK